MDERQPWYATTLLREPSLVVPLLAGASPILSLLLYFAGVTNFSSGIVLVLVPGIGSAFAYLAWARYVGRAHLINRFLGGLWAGLIATFVYDAVRVPIAHAGIPVFKAISYFGTALLAEARPSLVSEIVGWSYHLLNGVGFALMYVAVVQVPRWWTAVIWGVALEAAMLLTPYAEVFGYTRGGVFIAITLGSHILYGLALWAGWAIWSGERCPWARGTSRRRPAWIIALGVFLPVLGIAAVASDSHVSYAAALPTSPPPYVGNNLYTTWDVLEVDRVIAMWVLVRHVNLNAQFHFVQPFSKLRYGEPFDVPEAEIRRTGTQCTTEVLIEHKDLADDPLLRRLASIAHYHEIAPWLVISDSDARGFGQELKVLSARCRPAESTACLVGLFAEIDRWYEKESARSVAFPPAPMADPTRAGGLAPTTKPASERNRPPTAIARHPREASRLSAELNS